MDSLVIESEEHFFLANTSVELLEALGTVDVVMSRGLGPRNTSVKDWRDMLTDATTARVVGRSRHRWIFLSTLGRARRADLVLVQTSPEHGSLLKVLSYLLFVAMNRRRTVVVVHGITTHLPSNGISGRLRGRALRMARGVVFGTEGMRRRYVAAAGWASTEPSTTTIPVRLTPTPIPSPRVRTPHEPLRVGLLGGVTHKRRDFPLILEALDRLSDAERARIEVVTVGNCTKARCREITGDIARRVAVDVVEGHLTEERLLERGASCHVLVAAMSRDMDYGTGRATGAIGDALRLARPLLVSATIDPSGEFAGILHPFADAAGLAGLLRSALIEVPTVDPGRLEPYTARGAAARFRADLRIEVGAATP